MHGEWRGGAWLTYYNMYLLYFACKITHSFSFLAGFGPRLLKGTTSRGFPCESCTLYLRVPRVGYAISLATHWHRNCPILMSKFDFIVTHASQSVRVRKNYAYAACVADTNVSGNPFQPAPLIQHLSLYAARLLGATVFINICVTRCPGQRTTNRDGHCPRICLRIRNGHEQVGHYHGRSL